MLMSASCRSRSRLWVTSTGPPAGLYLMALASRLERTCSMRPPSTSATSWEREVSAPLGHRGNHALDDLHEIDRLPVQHQPPRLQTRHIQQVFGEPIQAVGRQVDLREHLLLPVGKWRA